MARFSRFLKPFRSKTTTNVKRTLRTRSRFRTGSSSFLRTFSTVARTYQRSPLRTNQLQISRYFPQAQAISLSKNIKLEVPRLRQGHNECGPTSLAMIMKYYGIDPGNYHYMFRSDTVGHGPLALAGKANAKNMLARYEEEGSINDIVQHIDNGCPVTVLGINGGCSNLTLTNYLENATKGHWVDAVGYKTNDAGQVTHVYVNDPNNPYYTECWTKDKFNLFWANNSIPTSHRFYMVFAKKGTMQESSLRAKLPSNKASDAFKATLRTIDALEDAFYALEAAGEGFYAAARGAANQVLDLADDIGDLAGDVWDEVEDFFDGLFG